MPLNRWKIAFLAALALTCAAQPAHALRVVTYNLLQYPGLSLSTRQPHFRTVMGAINADVVIAQELNSAAGRDSFLNNVLNVVQPGEWAATSWLSLSFNEGGAVFYKPAKVTVTGISQFSTGGPRDILQCLMKPAGYTSNAAATRLYSVHFKAGNGCSPLPCDTTDRRNECASLRSTLNAVPVGSNLLLGGDSNIYTAVEGAYLRLTEIQLDNDGRLKDPLAAFGLGAGTWHENSGFALYHTQCPCNTGCPGGFSGGGMDDRFDLWLTSYNMQDGEGLDYLEDFTVANGAYPFTYGNDGTKYNNDINAGGTNGMVPIAVANALYGASDHLPVVITLQVPAKVSVASALGFGSVLIGAGVINHLAVGNAANAPADELTYTLTAPAGFTAPGGTFTADAGSPANLHQIFMSAASVGVKSGTLTVNSDDVDVPTANVSLTGTVLDHAVSSLDSLAQLIGATLDFGDHPIGQFQDQALRVHNFGYNPLQSKLKVNTAGIVGGDGRFSIVGGFTPPFPLAGVGQTWNIHFNDTGANLDQEYLATLTIASTDEVLPGWTNADDLVLNLRAKPVAGTAGVPGEGLPGVLAFHPPHPNPLARAAVFSFDLPNAAPVSLAVYDLTGRRVSTVVSGSLDAGRYQLPWQAISESGSRLPAGLYFARFNTPGLSRLARLVLLP